MQLTGWIYHSVAKCIINNLVPCFYISQSNFTFFTHFLQIAIPMKFTGEGHVELRPPKNLEDLKAYTSISMSLQRPLGRGDGRRRRRQIRETEDMFVMYLGNKDVSASRYTFMFSYDGLHKEVAFMVLTICVL